MGSGGREEIYGHLKGSETTQHSPINGPEGAAVSRLAPEAAPGCVIRGLAAKWKNVAGYIIRTVQYSQEILTLLRADGFGVPLCLVESHHLHPAYDSAQPKRDKGLLVSTKRRVNQAYNKAECHSVASTMLYSLDSPSRTFLSTRPITKPQGARLYHLSLPQQHPIKRNKQKH